MGLNQWPLSVQPPKRKVHRPVRFGAVRLGQEWIWESRKVAKRSSSLSSRYKLVLPPRFHLQETLTLMGRAGNPSSCFPIPVLGDLSFFQFVESGRGEHAMHGLPLFVFRICARSLLVLLIQSWQCGFCADLRTLRFRPPCQGLFIGYQSSSPVLVAFSLV